MNIYKKLKIYRFAHSLSFFKSIKKVKCLIFGNFGALNLGDEAILYGQVSEIRSVQKDAEICVVSRYPSKINRTYRGSNIRAVYVKNIFSILREVSRADIVIVGGGGLFCKAGKSVNDILYQQYFMWLFMFLPKILNKKVYALGVGVYENMNRINLATANMMFRIIDKVTVRDLHSFNLLSKYKIESRLYKDNSYLAEIRYKNLKSLKIVQNMPKRIKIGFSLRRPNDNESAHKLLLGIIDYIKNNKNFEYFLFSLDSHPNKKNDGIFNRLLIDMAKKNKVKIKNIEIDNKNVINNFLKFKKMNYMICMRLHSMIFSDRLGVPFSGISYDIKCDSFLQTVGKKSIPIDDNLKISLDKEIKV